MSQGALAQPEAIRQPQGVKPGEPIFCLTTARKPPRRCYSQRRMGLELICMKRMILAAMAALALCSGCILDDEFWEDDYDSTYDSPSGDDWGDDCDCDE